jgi:hypothetical protein
MARFRKKNYFAPMWNALPYYNAGVAAVNSKVVGLVLVHKTKLCSRTDKGPS